MTDAAGSIQTSAVQPSEVRTFLIADVRGYTRFTLDYGDEAAARLAQSFAQLTEAVVTQRDGRVIELRGDEALAVFSSARQALRAAVELQTRLAQEANDVLPLRVGIGLDAGEAIPLEGGTTRSNALFMICAARVCWRRSPSGGWIEEEPQHSPQPPLARQRSRRSLPSWSTGRQKAILGRAAARSGAG